MRDVRRLHQCRHDGCDSEAQWQLLLSVRCNHLADWNRPAFMLSMPSTLFVCEKHCKAAIELATNDHAKGQIRMMCLAQGFGWPDFSSFVAAFAPVEHEAAAGNV